MLNEQFGATLPSGKKSQAITPDGTVVIASSVSNGGGAALAAAEEDKFGLIDGVAVSEPVINISPKTSPMIQRGGLPAYTGGLETAVRLLHIREPLPALRRARARCGAYSGSVP